MRDRTPIIRSPRPVRRRQTRRAITAVRSTQNPGYVARTRRRYGVPTAAVALSGGGAPSAQKQRQARAEKRADKQRKGAVSGIKEARKSLRKPLPGLDPEQSKVARTVLVQGIKQGASKKQLLSAAETGLVESGFRNLNYGDADSVGWRQERTSIYGPASHPRGPMNVKASAKRYFKEARASDVGQSAGDLAQAAQGSAFPERYAQVESQAKPIVKKVLKRAKKVERAGGKLKVPKGTLGPKRLPGPWGGAKRAVAKGLRGVASPSAGKRTPAENSAVGGSATSDHLTTNSSSYAKDISATGSAGTNIAHKVARNLGIKDFQPGSYTRYTSPRAPGYTFQILWQVEGHYDHVHVGAKWEGAGAAPAAGGYAGLTTGATTASAGTAAASAADRRKISHKRDKRAQRTRRKAVAEIERLREGLRTAPPEEEDAEPTTTRRTAKRVPLGLS